MALYHRVLILLFAGLFYPLLSLASGYTFLGQLSQETHIPEQVMGYSIVCILILFFGTLYKFKVANLSDQNLIIPDAKISLRNIMEFFGEKMLGLTESIVGAEYASRYFFLASSLFIVIFVSNLMGLIPGFLPPTSNINTTLALGLISFIYYNVEGIKAVGAWNHFKHLFGPVALLAPLMFVIELLSHSIRPLTLAIRLRSNMEGDHMVLSIFTDLTKVVIPVIFMGLGTFISFIQAFVFTILTLVYVKLAIDTHDHGDH